MKKLFSLILATIMLTAAITAAIPASAAKGAFSDVADDRWSASSVDYAVKNGYMKGVGGGKFDPEGSLTRAMVATVLWRREGEPKPDAPSGFKDVPAGEWYADAVAWAKETGVVKGITDKTFEPDGLITREQLATMLFRFSSSAPVSVPDRADLTPFADDAKVSDWATEPLEWAVEAGLIKGTDGNRLSPEGNATREQFAAIIERYDGSFKLTYNDPALLSHYTEPDYPLVTDADFYVSTTGSDSGDGSLAHPFATWNKAAEAVRALDKTGRQGITVAFFAGDYGTLDLTLNDADSGTPECPITYCKYGDGDVIFNNGFEFASDSFEPISEDEKGLFPAKAADKIKKIDISSAIPAGEYDLSYYVFSDTGLCTVARYPNKFDDGTDNLMAGAGYNSSANTIRITMRTMQKRIESYHTLDGVKIYGYLSTGWFKDTLSIGGYDPETGDLLITDPETARGGSLRYPEFPSADYHESALLNASEELDAPGEYWIDPATSVMYVYDPVGDYHMTLGDSTMLTLNEADDITLCGLTFQNSKDYMIYGYRCHDLTIDRCRVLRAGGMYAILLEDHDADRDLNFTLTRSEFDLAMDCFLRLDGHHVSDNVAFATHMNALIDNNSFTNYNLYLNEESAMYVVHCDEVKISHNEFINGGRGAVFYGLSQNVVMEYNYCRNQMINAADGGVFCTWNYFRYRGNIVRYNIIEDVASLGVGGFGLYIDDFAGGTDIYSNLFFNCDGSAVVVHNGRDNLMRNNVVVNTNGSPADFHVTLSGMYHPDIYGVPDDMDREYINRWNELFAEYEANPALKAFVTEHWPEIFDIHTDLERWDDKNFCLARNDTITGNRFFSKTGGSGEETAENVLKYSTVEDNVGYTLDENPFFVNPTRGDYRIRDGVDFPDIHFESIGRY